MQLYLTGPTQPNRPQIDNQSSLGGFISTTLVSNAVLSNVFTPISKHNIANIDTETRCIGLLNTLGRQVTNVQVYTVTPLGAYANIVLGISPAYLDRITGNQYFESIPDGSSAPFSFSFSSAEGIPNALVVPVINDGQAIAIWLKRSLNPLALPTLGGLSVPIQSFIDRYNNIVNNIPIVVPLAGDTISLMINYT